jgi:hypothetical protein
VVAQAPPGAEPVGFRVEADEPSQDRLERLEREVATLRAEVASLREALGG